MSDTGVAAAAAAAAAAIAAPAGNWHDSLQGDDRNFIVAKGYDKLDATKAALAAINGHRAAEHLIGGDPKNLMKVPKDAGDTEAWNNINTKLGVPADAKDYDFSTVKMKDGSDLDVKLTDALRPVLQKAHVSKADAAEVAKAIVSHLDTGKETDVAAKAAALDADRAALRISWGSNIEGHLAVARNAITALNVTQEAVDALEKSAGYGAVMKMFYDIGTKIGEDTFVRTQTPGGNSVLMSKDQAAATLAEKQNDSAFVKRLMSGDTTAQKEFDNLTRMVAGTR